MTLSYWTWDWRRMFPSFWFWRPVRCCSVICSAWRGHPSSRSWGDGWAFGNLFWNYLRKKNVNLNYFWDTKGRKVWVVEVNISSRMVSQKWSYANNKITTNMQTVNSHNEPLFKQSRCNFLYPPWRNVAIFPALWPTSTRIPAANLEKLPNTNWTFFVFRIRHWYALHEDKLLVHFDGLGAKNCKAKKELIRPSPIAGTGANFFRGCLRNGCKVGKWFFQVHPNCTAR